jgi:hypothetical protein
VDIRPELAALHVAGDPERWRALGFAVDDGRIALGAAELALGGAGAGITGWELRNIDAGTTLVDGLVTTVAARPSPRPRTHPNGAVGLDQVVIATPDFDRTAAALQRSGMGLRRVREADGVRQGFRRLGPAILEIVEDPGHLAGPARFWGLVVIVNDLEALHDRLRPHLGQVRPAVQPGRHIATLSGAAGLGARVAFMDPE